MELHMVLTSTPDEGPRVAIRADVGQYVAGIRQAALATLEAEGFSPEEAVRWLEEAERYPSSEEAMRFYRRRYVTGADAAAEDSDGA
jgi:hypothetical protein